MAAITARGQFNLVLSGGSTPRPVYERLSVPEFRDNIDWSAVHLFWGDERMVSPEDPESNFHMAALALLNNAPIPLSNIHRMRGEIEAQAAAEDYQSELRKHFGGDGLPHFDLVLLGLGNDGHTVSLFPQSAALSEQDDWVAANYIEKLDAWRLTLTLPAINAAREAVFVVSGATKAGIVQRVLQGEDFPAGKVQPGKGTLRWFLDEAAASLL